MICSSLSITFSHCFLIISSIRSSLFSCHFCQRTCWFKVLVVPCLGSWNFFFSISNQSEVLWWSIQGQPCSPLYSQWLLQSLAYTRCSPNQLAYWPLLIYFSVVDCISLLWLSPFYSKLFFFFLPNLPTLSLSHRVHKPVLYISVSFAVSYTGLSLPSF